jgi:excisionase family DNA binding protein
MQVQARQTDPLLTEKQAAKILGVQPSTLQVWRSTKRYPLPYVKSGRLVRYRASAVQEFIELRTVAA